MNNAQLIILVLGVFGLLAIVVMNVLAFTIYLDVKAWDAFEECRSNAPDMDVEEVFIEQVEATLAGGSLRAAVFKLGATGVRKVYLETLQLIPEKPGREPGWRRIGQKKSLSSIKTGGQYGN